MKPTRDEIASIIAEKLGLPIYVQTTSAEVHTAIMALYDALHDPAPVAAPVSFEDDLRRIAAKNGPEAVAFAEKILAAPVAAPPPDEPALREKKAAFAQHLECPKCKGDNVLVETRDENALSCGDCECTWRRSIAPPPAPLDEEGLVEKVGRIVKETACLEVRESDDAGTLSVVIVNPLNVARAAIAAMRESGMTASMDDEYLAMKIAVLQVRQQYANALGREAKERERAEAAEGQLREIENREGEVTAKQPSAKRGHAEQGPATEDAIPAKLASPSSLPAELEVAIKETDGYQYENRGEIWLSQEHVEAERGAWRNALAEKDAEIEVLSLALENEIQRGNLLADDVRVKANLIEVMTRNKQESEEEP